VRLGNPDYLSEFSSAEDSGSEEEVFICEVRRSHKAYSGSITLGKCKAWAGSISECSPRRLSCCTLSTTGWLVHCFPSAFDTPLDGYLLQEAPLTNHCGSPRLNACWRTGKSGMEDHAPFSPRESPCRYVALPWGWLDLLQRCGWVGLAAPKAAGAEGFSKIPPHLLELPVPLDVSIPLGYISLPGLLGAPLCLSPNSGPIAGFFRDRVAWLGPSISHDLGEMRVLRTLLPPFPGRSLQAVIDKRGF